VYLNEEFGEDTSPASSNVLNKKRPPNPGDRDLFQNAASLAGGSPISKYGKEQANEPSPFAEFANYIFGISP
jgi:hypothetical protein